MAALAEEGQGRYEALVAALTANAGLRWGPWLGLGAGGSHGHRQQLWCLSPAAVHWHEPPRSPQPGSASCCRRAEVAANQARISGLGEQVEALRRDVAALAGTAAAGQPPAGAGSASQGARPVGPERQPATPLNAGPEKQGQAVPVASVPLVPSAPAAATRPAALPLQPGLAGLAVPGMPQALLLQRAPGQPPAANLMPGPLLMSALLQQHMQAASRPSASWPSGPATTGPLPPPFVPSGAAPPSVPLADKKAGAGTGASASAAKK